MSLRFIVSIFACLFEITTAHNFSMPIRSPIVIIKGALIDHDAHISCLGLTSIRVGLVFFMGIILWLNQNQGLIIISAPVVA